MFSYTKSTSINDCAAIQVNSIPEHFVFDFRKGTPNHMKLQKIEEAKAEVTGKTDAKG